MADLAPWEKYGKNSVAAGSEAGPWMKYRPDYLHPDDMVEAPGAADQLAKNEKLRSELPMPDSPDAAHTAQPDESHTGFLAPVTHNRRTGEWSLSVPGIVTGTAQSIGDAATLPGDALSGKYDAALDPRNGPYALGSDPELIGRGLNFAATVSAGTPLPRTLGPEVLGREAVGFADRLGVPLTKGQGTGDLAQLTKEEAIRQGQGSGANIMRNFDARQREAISGVADTIGQGLGENPESMTDSVVQAIQNKVAFHKDQAASFYEIAKDGGVSIKPEMVDALPTVVSGALEAGAIHVDQALTPGASAAIKILEEDTAKMTGALAEAGKQPGAIAGSGGITLEGIDQIRKKLVNLGEGANPTDARALRAIRKAYDDWTEAAVDNMLVSGDDAALEALKKARGASAEYLHITSPREGDVAGAAVKKMQAGDATAEEVANWLYGADVASPTLNAPKVAERVKSLVGPDSPEWNAVRASAWERLVKDQKSATGEPLSNAMMAKRIETFLNAKGTSLSKVLYTPEERATMQQFADVLKATQTPRDATNPSRTAWTLAGTMNGITRLLAGGTVTSVAGPQAGAAAFFAIPVFKNIGARNAALRATGVIAEKTKYPVALGMANAIHAPGALGGLSAPVLKDVGSGLHFLGFGGNDDALSPAIAPPGGGLVNGGTMTLNDWVKQQGAAGKLAA